MIRMTSHFYNTLAEELFKIVSSHNLPEEKIIIKARILSPEEAIGTPTRKEFPLVKGVERLIEANFKGAIGHAFTDAPSNYEGTLKEVSQIPLTDNRNRAIFIATLNAVMRHLGLLTGTIHCKNDEPELCAEQLVNELKKQYRNPKVALVGFQPAFVDHLKDHFKIRVTDCNPNNIGKEKYGVLVEDGYSKNKEVVEWSDIALVTGSTVVNGTIEEFLPYKEKIIFYGVTIAGVAEIMNLKRFCVYSK